MKYAIEVEKTGSISQAAENLYMGQPNLSKAIKELEASLGIQIFTRTSKGVITTQAGVDFLRRIRKIIGDIEEMELLYRSNEASQEGFRISVPRSSYIACAFTNLVASLDAQAPAPVVFSETNAMHAIRNVLDEGYNLGIIRYQIPCEPYFLQLLQDQGLAYETVWEFDSLVLLPADHPAARKEVLESADLKDSIELIHGDCGVHDHSQCQNNHEGKTPCTSKRICIYERGSQFDLLTRIPGTYMWVSPVPPDVLVRNNLVQRHCADASNRCKDVLVYRRGYTFSTIENKFLDKLEEAKELVAQYQYA